MPSTKDSGLAEELLSTIQKIETTRGLYYDYPVEIELDRIKSLVNAYLTGATGVIYESDVRTNPSWCNAKKGVHSINEVRKWNRVKFAHYYPFLDAGIWCKDAHCTCRFRFIGLKELARHGRPHIGYEDIEHLGYINIDDIKIAMIRIKIILLKLNINLHI